MADGGGFYKEYSTASASLRLVLSLPRHPPKKPFFKLTLAPFSRGLLRFGLFLSCFPSIRERPPTSRVKINSLRHAPLALEVLRAPQYPFLCRTGSRSGRHVISFLRKGVNYTCNF